MIIKSFHAANFRNIKECNLEFDDSVNLLLGENAQGKTNAVEGIYLFARGKSLFAKAHKILVVSAAEGFSSCKYIYSLDGIRFSLGVVSEKKVNAIGKLYIALIYITEVARFKSFYFHYLSSFILIGRII